MPGRRPIDHGANEPATLYRVMQAMIGEGLKAHYEVPQKMSHELFVLLMQMNAANSSAPRRSGKPASTNKRHRAAQQRSSSRAVAARPRVLSEVP